ncbi:amidase [Nitratireductor sp. StC3]|uniref:amidase n=1 Tax=Nitratireductor sp. StC3 TaxID=2126741 RepID=UPI000D0D572C|nr:amidase [Nitratireductor sp. StC3]PSM18541.1 Asp-tRNA(Asn)/Glu-tRNA(Gln) amidotransferase GatCAB subunit A [Nitratireductor sp. StC3]
MFENPDISALEDAAERLGLSPKAGYLDKVSTIVEALSAGYADLDLLPDLLPAVAYPRRGGERPAAEDNPFGAWYVKTDIAGAAEGPLAGRRVAIKDSIYVAGVPMMHGSSLFEGFVPDMDATVVTRILDAGGVIAGKAVCENYCVSGGSHTSSTGPVINPRCPGHSAGGSSSGSAALVAAGEVDMAIGGDQAGSIRIPSAYCGTYGMKPTFGLVPYTGMMSLEQTIDHAGPITGNVRDNALLLQAIAGDDGLDARQRAVKVQDYAREIGKDLSGLRIGVVQEGFGHPNSQADVDASVRAAAQTLAALGAEVSQISIPMHTHAFGIWAALAHDGGYWMMMETNGMGVGLQAPVATDLPRFGSQWRRAGDDMSDPLKIMALFGAYSTERYLGHYYAKAQRVRRRLKAAYDEALQSCDLLVMPTLPVTATPLPETLSDPVEVTDRSWEMIRNTSAFNVSGHPAMSVPCGLSEGRPIGMMLIAAHWNEPTIYRAAAAFEAAVDWQKEAA